MCLGAAITRCRPTSLDYYLLAEALGEAVTMSDDDQLLMHRLRAHVTLLAEEIGERNVFNSRRFDARPPAHESNHWQSALLRSRHVQPCYDRAAHQSKNSLA